MDFTSINNYYEHLVINYIYENLINNSEKNDIDEEQILDIACYALTKLPARYVRHAIDMAYYLDTKERMNMDQEVEKAVKNAIKHMENNSDYGEH